MERTSSATESSPGRQIVLFLDGTGNTIRGDGTETNIVKMFRMVDRTNENQFCYYQPGIGVDVTFSSLAKEAGRGKFKPKSNALDMALANSFDEHVVSGYRFLMRRYKPGDKVYMFGFSRGAYTARFLSEMLDRVGLLNPDNEQLVPYVWAAYASWRFSRPHLIEKWEAHKVLTIVRETMCRPIERTHFLGLFDTVNSVAKYRIESDLIPATRIIRHAVSIDERRMKFQPVLILPTVERANTKKAGMHRASGHVVPPINPSQGDAATEDDEDDDFQDIEEIYFAGNHGDVGGGWKLGDGEKWLASHVPLLWMVNEAMKAGLTFDTVKLQQFGCDTREGPNGTEEMRNALESAERAQLHDSLAYESGKRLETFFWRLLECLPLKRVFSMPDGSQEMSRRPVIGGLRRYMPSNAKVHGSVIRRLQAGNYRPVNLLHGSAHRLKHDRKEYGIGEWVLAGDEGGWGESYTRKMGKMA